MAVKRGISIQKGRRQTKHGFPIGSADRAAQDLALSRYKEPAEPLEGQGEPIAPKALVRRRVALRSVQSAHDGWGLRLVWLARTRGTASPLRNAARTQSTPARQLGSIHDSGRVPWLWRVSQTRRTSVERIMPSGTNDCPTELSSRVTRRHENSSSERGFDSPQG